MPRHARALALRAWKVLRVNWHLGVTGFGGPAVNFKTVSDASRTIRWKRLSRWSVLTLPKFNEKFVIKTQWIDEQLYQELFSIVQSLSGPASTKMLYCINLIRDGLPAALFSFLLWR